MQDFQTIIKRRDNFHEQPLIFHGFAQFRENGHLYFALKVNGKTEVWSCDLSYWDLVE